MPKRFLLLLVVIMITTSAFAGGQDESAADEAVTIQIAYPVAVDAPVTEILDQYAQEFMQANPGVTVETVYAGGYGDVRTTVQTTIDGGGEPPALAVMLATDLFDLANAQYIEPLTPYIDSMDGGVAYLDDFLPAFLENSYYTGDLWSLPFQRSAVVMYYNEDMLVDAGLGVPTDWQTLAQTASALTERDGDAVTRWGIEWPSGWPYWLFQPLAIGAGQNIVGDSDTEVFFDEPEVIDAINYYISLSEQWEATPAGVQASWGNVVPNFVSGNTAMIVHSSGSLSNVLNQAGFTVGVAAIPGQNGGAYSVPGGGNLYMTAGLTDAQKQAAFEFAVFITDAARAADFSIQTGYIATRESAFAQESMQAYISENPQAGQTRDALATAGKELAVQNLGEVRNIFHSYLQAAFNGELDAAQAMASAQTEADAALEDFR